MHVCHNTHSVPVQKIVVDALHIEETYNDDAVPSTSWRALLIALHTGAWSLARIQR